jgi:hypothetical protein
MLPGQSTPDLLLSFRKRIVFSGGCWFPSKHLATHILVADQRVADPVRHVILRPESKARKDYHHQHSRDDYQFI